MENNTTFCLSSTMVSKQYHIPAGEQLISHKHEYDHISVLASGTAIIDVDGTKSTITGPTAISIEAGKHHGVYAVNNCVWFCVHKIPDELQDTTDENKILESLIEGA